MNIIICSDIHDHISHLKTFLSKLPEAEAMICCGDLCSPFIIALLAKNFDKDIHIVFGNNDGDQFRMSQLAAKFPHVKLHGEMMDIALDGKKIFANHFPDITKPIASSGFYDVVCYGHNHLLRTEEVAGSWLINPGTLMGYAPGNDEIIPATFVLYDTQFNQVQAFEVKEDDIFPMMSIF